MDNLTEAAKLQEEEEAIWLAEAAKKRIPLVELKPDSSEPRDVQRMDATYKVLKVEDPIAQLRLNQLIKRLQKEQELREQQERELQANAQRPKWDLNSTRIQGLEPVKPSPLAGEPRELLGRSEACGTIMEIARDNCLNRYSTDHASFGFLIAAGHVRSGKTRMGIETPGLVKKVSEENPLLQTLNILQPPVYLKMDFLNGCKYDRTFDKSDLPASVSLGARLMYAFYGSAPGLEVGHNLQDITHEDAIFHIVSRVLSENQGNDTVVPIVCHFDEHGQFTSEVSRGQGHFVAMLREIGGLVTSSSSKMRKEGLHGRYFIVPITTGTSKRDANIGRVSSYKVRTLALPSLSFVDTQNLAREYFGIIRVEHHLIENELKQPSLQVGLADTGGLPGLVAMACEGGICPTGNYSRRLQTNVNSYTARSAIDWSGRWATLVTVFLARPTVDEDTKVDDDYTVAQARDSGTILFSDHEVGLAPSLFRSFNERPATPGGQFVNSLLLKHISKIEEWTWQDFEKAHALYLSAVMAALIQEQSRFHPTVKLENLLRHAKPEHCAHLGRALELPNEFVSNGLKIEKKQSIPKTGSKRKRHSVDLETKEKLVLACDGMPIIDAHLNLRLTRNDGPNRNEYGDVVLFVQYNHSKLESDTTVKVSEMNTAVELLSSRLERCQWKGDWLFLWVSNRNIIEDTKNPHPRLLWVGKNELVKHAPLIGRRGLVPAEMVRPDEEVEDA